jgi:hypothetical protein
MRTTLIRAAWVIVLALGWVAGRAQGRPEPQFVLERVVSTRSPDLVELRGQQTERLVSVCNGHDRACFLQHFSDTRRQIAVLHASSDSSSPPVAYLHAVLKVAGEGYAGLTFGLELELATSREQFVSWFDEIDWQYATFVHGVRTRGDWLQLLLGNLFR